MVKKVFGETVTTVTTFEIVISVTNVTNFTYISIITVMCEMLLLKSCKGTYFTKSYNRQTDQPTDQRQQDCKVLLSADKTLLKKKSN